MRFTMVALIKVVNLIVGTAIGIGGALAGLSAGKSPFTSIYSTG
jgi:ABC-type methionine transport system permease subunit